MNIQYMTLLEAVTDQAIQDEIVTQKRSSLLTSHVKKDQSRKVNQLDLY